jgi:uncharacterized sporulation protein YeaH/YhbH (DUF444 family)
MALRIHSDYARFRSIVKGRVRENLRRFIVQGELVAQHGQKKVSIPLSEIRLPRFRHSWEDQSQVGQGEGKEGDALGQGQEAEGGGGGQAGDQPGDHPLEVELSLEELAQILGEELSLPRIQPRGRKVLKSWSGRFTGIRRTGPESLVHFKRTFKSALRRTVASGEYNPGDPIVVPVREDKRYRSRKEVLQPQSAAAIVYMMDVSGSMGDEQKEMVRIEAFWIDLWLRSHYKNLQIRYITHDASAREVDRDTFFRSKESGGTLISSAYTLAGEMVKQDYPVEDWNIYLFHFSDGDNWSDEDSSLCVSLLNERLLPSANLFAYGQVKSAYGSGAFIEVLEKNFPGREEVALSRIDSKDQILDSIRDFLGKGR